ncbi:MAG: ABC transporter permease [Carboxylicivirga sp.]|jgi:putative ABC transport system permease protein|nr:ABC transporter permease [Carboxylicivirga sp.]
MLEITLKNILRSFKRHLSFSIINLVGLVLGFVVFIFIGHYLLYENSFDKFWSGQESIYRINRVNTQNGETVYDGAKTPDGIYYSKDEIPELDACAYVQHESCQVRRKPHALFEQNVLWVSHGFQDVFNFEMKEGVADFEKTHTGIISENKAQVLFGNENPIGQIIKVNEGMPIEITGVFRNLPANTHLVADYFISLRTWVDYGWISEQGGWGWNGWWTYVKLKETCTPEKVEASLTKLVEVHYPKLKNENRTITYNLQPLGDIHFDTSKQGDYGKKANKSSIINLFIFGIFVLIVAWINYANLSTALALKKEKSIGIQKLVGAGKTQQVIYVIIDNLFFNLFAAIVAWILFFILSPVFSNAFDIPLHQSYLPKGVFILSFIVTICVGLLLSSFYSISSILKINTFAQRTVSKESVFQRGLVITQLTITIVFIGMSFAIYRQMNFIQQRDLGMDLDKVLVLSAPTSYNGQENPLRAENPKFDKFKHFKNELLKNTDINAVTASFGLPGSEMRSNDVHYHRTNIKADINARFSTMIVDNGYTSTFGLQLLAGSPLPDSKYKYGQEVLINEEAMKALQFESPEDAVGQLIRRYRNPVMISGVLKNFHFEGLQKKIYPIVLEYGHPTEFGYYSINVNTANVSSVIKDIESVWKQYYPNDPFNCFFQDKFYNQQYESFKRMGTFNIIFAIISIFISCLGLYGIIMFFIARKTKEIGVRKVNGATIAHVMCLLNLNLFIWLGIAFIIATPIAWYAINKWLGNFAYQTDLSWWIFVLAGMVTLSIALLTVSWQSWRAARRNPV